VNLLPSCREVREHLTDYSEGALPLRERVALRLHLLLCGACADFFRGLKALPGMAKTLLAHQPEPPPPAAFKALEGALRQIRARPPQS
jgi:hypothetical protein